MAAFEEAEDGHKALLFKKKKKKRKKKPFLTLSRLSKCV